jgi:FKBP-type peptidyl-prolyl cis-trans isomerase
MRQGGIRRVVIPSKLAYTFLGTSVEKRLYERQLF